MTKRCRHQWEQKSDYPEDILCRKCETIKKVADLTRREILKLPMELRRAILKRQAEAVAQEYVPPCPVAGCTAVVRPGILRELIVCPVHGEQWVGEEDEL